MSGKKCKNVLFGVSIIWSRLQNLAEGQCASRVIVREYNIQKGKTNKTKTIAPINYILCIHLFVHYKLLFKARKLGKLLRRHSDQKMKYKT